MAEVRRETFAACARFDVELQAHLEGESRPFILSHSQECTSCGALLAELDSVREATQHLPLEEPSPALWQHVRAQLAAEGAFALPACAQFGGELEAYLEGEQQPFVLAHAHECNACGTLLANLEAIQQSARTLPLEEPSPALWTNVHAKLLAEGIINDPACGQFEAELQAFMEGAANPFMVTHAKECAACGSLLADLHSIQQAAHELPLEEPSPVVWANVRARLEADGAFEADRSGWRHILSWRLFPQAVPLGVLAALMFVGSLVTLPTTTSLRWNRTEEAASTSPATQTASVLLTGDDTTLARVVSDLESSFKANESSMAPDLKATYEKSLVSLDGSIRECLDSLRREPGNTLAHDYLLSAYTSKAEVLSSALEFEGR